MDKQSEQRLNKFLALQLGISRRQADDLISSGKISINEQKATLGARFKPSDTIKLGEKTISTTPEEKVYILFNKPRNYVSSRKKQGDNETIYAILPKEFKALKPVGRLDKDSSGLLLLTNDGDFAFRFADGLSLETLFGWLWLRGEKDRISELFELIVSEEN